MKHFGQLETTIRPARQRFADIVWVYLEQRQAVPPSVTDGFDKLCRILQWASYELRIGLWESDNG